MSSVTGVFVWERSTWSFRSSCEYRWDEIEAIFIYLCHSWKNSTLFRAQKESKVMKEHLVKKAQGWEWKYFPVIMIIRSVVYCCWLVGLICFTGANRTIRSSRNQWSRGTSHLHMVTLYSPCYQWLSDQHCFCSWFLIRREDLGSKVIRWNLRDLYFTYTYIIAMHSLTATCRIILMTHDGRSEREMFAHKIG